VRWRACRVPSTQQRPCGSGNPSFGLLLARSRPKRTSGHSIGGNTRGARRPGRAPGRIPARSADRFSSAGRGDMRRDRAPTRDIVRPQTLGMGAARHQRHWTGTSVRRHVLDSPSLMPPPPRCRHPGTASWPIGTDFPAPAGRAEPPSGRAEVGRDIGRPRGFTVGTRWKGKDRECLFEVSCPGSIYSTAPPEGLQRAAAGNERRRPVLPAFAFFSAASLRWEGPSQRILAVGDGDCRIVSQNGRIPGGTSSASTSQQGGKDPDLLKLRFGRQSERRRFPAIADSRAALRATGSNPASWHGRLPQSPRTRRVSNDRERKTRNGAEIRVLRPNSRMISELWRTGWFARPSIPFRVSTFERRSWGPRVRAGPRCSASSSKGDGHHRQRFRADLKI